MSPAVRPALAAGEAPSCQPVARVVSIQGSLQVQRGGEPGWSNVRKLDTVICQGDLLRTGPTGRAALLIAPETLFRVHQNSTVSIRQSPEETTVEYQVNDGPRASAVGPNACGAGYFITRFPRKFRVLTPFINASVEGTEFLVALQCDSATVSVFEGKVTAQQLLAAQSTAVSLKAGEQISAGGTEPPTVRLIIKPVDAVQWTLYYPPLTLPAGEAVADQQCNQDVPMQRGQCLLQRAEQRLRMGRVEEAEADLEALTALAPNSGEPYAERAIIRLAKNDKVEALTLAQRATALSPDSPRAWIASSYAYQAAFELDKALGAAREAMEVAPRSAVSRTRVAELLLTLGRTRDAENVARETVASDPDSARSHLVLGLIHLAQLDTGQARADFLAAIDRDSTDPLARLGLGLALIRDGNLKAGREQIEIAVVLDPASSLARSYLGRAYYEENTRDRNKLAESQFRLAETLDPRDPTPWFYDAIRLQAENRPIEAVQAMRESERLNDDRVVYRPQTALDQDAAARNVGMARLYAGLNFTEPAQAETGAALASDPTSYAAQQYLSDVSSFEDRQQSTRASAGLQAQLRQPLGADAQLVGLTNASSLVPERPFLSAASIGPQRAGLYDFDPVFTIPGFNARIGGLLGEFGTSAYSLSAAQTFERLGLSAGMAHTQTDGQRTNNDQSRDAYAALITAKPSAALTLQLDLQHSSASFGDLPIRWDENNVAANDKNTERFTVSRVAALGDISVDSQILGAVTYLSSTGELRDDFTPYSISVDAHSTISEAQYVYARANANIVAGVSYIGGDGKSTLDFPGIFTDVSRSTDREKTAYVYGTVAAFGQSLRLTAGGAWDDAELGSVVVNEERFYPKIGLQFHQGLGTSLRLAYIESIQRPIPAGQTLEPVQVAGFAQMYDDPYGTRSHQLAGALDHRFGEQVYIGLNGMKRWLDVPYVAFDQSGQRIGATTDWTEDRIGAYVRFLPNQSTALSLQIVDQHFDRSDKNQGLAAFLRLNQVRVPAMVQWFNAAGFSTYARATYWHQDGTFCESGATDCTLDGDEGTTIVDLGLSQRLPMRKGFVSLDVLNVFDKQFRYQSIDTSSLVPFTGRAVFARVLLNL